jgi:hypothetical protein
VACTSACGSNEPKLTQLSTLKQTAFVPTLEDVLPDNKNVIYTPTFLYAWDGVKQLFKSPITVSADNSETFRLINNSNSYKNSLRKDECQTEAALIDGEIDAEANFNLALPFPTTMQKLNSGIPFGKERVSGFGMNFLDDDIIKFTQILFYKDDDNFIIRFIPKDETHEIILVKGLQNIKKLSDAIKQTNALIAVGTQEDRNQNSKWKYEFRDEDSFGVPVIKFNIETNYKTVEGQSFQIEGIKRTIQTACQQTSLVLDENGAIIKSKSVIASSDSVGEPPKIHPKKMIFDKPFFIIMKHTGNLNPYFVMKVENAELLVQK